jgi:hypothetical protein
MELTPAAIKRASGHFDLGCVTHLDLSCAGGSCGSLCRLLAVVDLLLRSGITQLAHLDACVSLVDLNLARNLVRRSLSHLLFRKSSHCIDT